ncbi:Hypothetical_protein [Hexamita inflata]|uniref:Hypothetical_protein n=1 Tax=Hexamita inflata TaxID=28002 RepID=A0AA86Q5G8_9EUKA|nr:Hypothetical protein HINF_LOCUS34147 [Hexamita inflata]
MSVLMRRENTLIIEPGSDISKIQIINFILLPNSKKHFEGPPLYQIRLLLHNWSGASNTRRSSPNLSSSRTRAHRSSSSSRTRSTNQFTWEIKRSKLQPNAAQFSFYKNTSEDI